MSLPGTREVLRGSDVLPAINALVRISVGTSTNPEGPWRATDVPSRIEDVQEMSAVQAQTELYVAAPWYPGNVEPIRPDTICLVFWTTDRGLVELPTAFGGDTAVRDGVLVWRLRVIGPAVRVERRKFFRVMLAMPLALQMLPNSPSAGARAATAGQGQRTTIAAAGDILVEATSIDVSESGLRCLAPPPVLPVGSDVMVGLDIEQSRLRLRAEVIRSDPGPNGPRDPCETVLNFCDAAAYSDAMRRLVYAEQLRQRRAGLH